MTIPLQYTYFLGALLSFIPWLIIFLLKRNIRKEMIEMSVLFCIFAILAEYFLWTTDYWHPVTLTHTRIGIEDIVLGFSNGGVITVCYEFFFNKRHRVIEKKSHHLKALLLGLFISCFFLVLFSMLHLNSAFATSGAFFIGSLLIVYVRHDLLPVALWSGCIVVLGALPVYLLLEYLSPGFVSHTWFMSNLTRITFLGIPLEDLLYYFTLGSLLGPFYLFWKHEKFLSP